MYPSESVRRAATAGVALMAVFPVTVVILNLVQLGRYNPAADAISLLALGRGGLALNVAFITGGAVSFIMAWVLRRTVTNAVSPRCWSASSAAPPRVRPGRYQSG